MSTVRIERVEPEATYELRSRVLRQGRAVQITGDHAPSTVHLAAVTDEGRVVGVVRFHPQVCPWRDTEYAWQLRGMATDPEVRGLGAGRALVAEGLVQISRAGADLVWCDAREAAVGFYERIGFTVVSPPYDMPPVGIHLGMVLDLPIR
ncbi:GNAT family N-acetyltransferase [Klenkia brasiliensis]|uniref:Predicted N-acyltransferase, GNAT family n=1 Tax=Klenkia brasiliensis TaxID=333142 RepID=A0A1G7LPK7_9ACTN|nr:GNAT family N-acetyltransferase [Klenkia brasiliensis]SDF50889.1 Predicted N-acyltransferase, GNAT family [Klenkia brasiliensis]